MGFIGKLMREVSAAAANVPAGLLAPAPADTASAGPAWITATEKSAPGVGFLLGDSLVHVKDAIRKAGYSGELYNFNQAPSESEFNPAFNSWLNDNGYSVQVRYVGSDLQNRLADRSGNTVGDVAHYDTNDGGWFEKAVLLGIGAMTGGLGATLGSALGLGSGAAASAVGGGLVGGATSAAMGGDFLRGAVSGGIGGALSGAIGSTQSGSLTGPGALDAYAAMDAAYGTAGVGGASGAAGAAGAAGGATGLGSSLVGPGTMDAYAALDAGYGVAGGGAAESVVPAAFNAAADSQAYNASAGITGGQSASAATVPATVNLTNAGGTMATTGGITGAANTAAQAIRDATASSDLGGGLLSQAGSVAGDALSTAGNAAGDVAAWMKANPVLGKLLMSGATSLLSASGSTGSAGAGTGSTESYGSPVQWQSNIQRGLLSPVRRATPPQLSGLGLLDVAGQQNDGAWRYLKG